jgi:hypothetical protein
LSLPGQPSRDSEKKVSRRADGALLGLAIAFFVLAGSQNDPRVLAQYGAILLLPAAIILVAITGRAWIAAVSLFVLGVIVRAMNLDHGYFGSDVLPVTKEAIETLFDGTNPYGHHYVASTNPFAYPPGNLLYYLPGYLLSDIRGTEIASGAIVLAGFAGIAWLIRDDGPLVAMGAYAVAPPLLLIATDASNDTSAGALLFLSIVLMFLAHRHLSTPLLIVSALVMGEALAFKQYILPFWPALIGYLSAQRWTISVRSRQGGTRRPPAWVVYTAISAAFVVVTTLPFLIWSPSAFIDDQFAWSDVAIHPIFGWNVWAFLLRWQGWNAQDALGDLLPGIDITLASATLVVGLITGIRTPSRAITVGVAAWFVLMLFARWTTFAYFAGVIPAVMLIPFADRIVGMSDERIERETAAVRPAVTRSLRE